MWERTGHTTKGRDGCRVPLPWTRSGSSHGFGPGGSWLPQPDGWGEHAVEAQAGRPDSFLELYRTALSVRTGFRGDESFDWLPAREGELAFRKGRFECRINLCEHSLPLSAGPVLLASDSLDGDMIGPDTAVWTAVTGG